MTWRDDTETTSMVVRARRVLAGEGMVTPVRTISLGGSDRLEPGITRLAVDHDLVRKQPELFEPADRSDRSTRSALRSLLKAAELEVSRELARRRGEPEPRTSSRATLNGLRSKSSKSNGRPYWALTRRHDARAPRSAGVLPLPSRSARRLGA